MQLSASHIRTFLKRHITSLSAITGNIIQKDNYTVYRYHGGIYGMQNWFMVCPEYNLGISVLSNSSFVDAGEILEELLEGLFDEIKDLE